MCFFLHNASSKKGAVREAAEACLRRLMGELPWDVQVLLSGGEDLEQCKSSKRAGQCRHMAQVIKSMGVRYGERWRQIAVAEFLISNRGSSCPAVSGWVFQVFWQVVELLDGMADSDLLSTSAVGQEVLRGKHRLRRIVGTLVNESGLTVDRRSSDRVVLGKDSGRGLNEQRSEQLQMAAYLEHSNRTIGGAAQFSLPVDCSSVSGREVLTMALFSTAKRQAVWLPLQAAFSTW